MRIVIRTDASISIGSGHVMRCLTIAEAFRKLGHHISFWMEDSNGNMVQYVAKQGYNLIQSMQSVDILIVDHYQLDIEWESKMRPFARKIVVIDDLANRPHDCDILIDQNLVHNYEHRYNSLVPQHCKLLLGPVYLILREEFVKARLIAQPRNGLVNRLLVFMGGSDPTHETMKVLQALVQTKLEFEHIDVVVGVSNSQRHDIKQICNRQGYHYHCQIDYLAQLMLEADISLGAGGATAWERCYLGLPSSSTVVASNQQASTIMAAEKKAIINLGWHEQVDYITYGKFLNEIPNMKHTLQLISHNGYNITESQGVINPWLQEMVEL